MDNINAKLQYLKGMKDGISKLDGDRYLLVEEIINTLEVMVQESAKISESMQKEIEKLQSHEFDANRHFPHRQAAPRHTNYDYFDDITAPFSYKNQPKEADVWYDESLNVGDYLKQETLTPANKDSIKVERICKHCGSYVSCSISADELNHSRIQCPKCKRFLLPFDNNGIDVISKDIDEQIENLEPPSLTTDIAKRLSSTPKTFHWEVSEEVFNDDDDDEIDDHYNINSIIKDFETHGIGAETELHEWVQNDIVEPKVPKQAWADYQNVEREPIQQERPVDSLWQQVQPMFEQAVEEGPQNKAWNEPDKKAEEPVHDWRLEQEKEWNKPEITDFPLNTEAVKASETVPKTIKVEPTEAEVLAIETEPVEAKAQMPEAEPVETVTEELTETEPTMEEVKPNIGADEAAKSKEEDENFDWNTDFEFSIDKILSMDKKEKEDANSSDSNPDTDSKFNNDGFGKFNYTFDRDEELERQRNKIAPNYNIDKKVLKKFSFLGYASELANKKNN